MAPEYPLGVVRPKLESTLSMGAPLLAGIDSLVMTVLIIDYHGGDEYNDGSGGGDDDSMRLL